MANTVYANKLIASKAAEILTTQVNARSLMTIDSTLEQTEGMTKTVNTYTYSGTPEELAAGVGSTEDNRGAVTFVGKDYTVKVVQQVFPYTDEDEMKDSAIVDFGVEGATKKMANFLTSKFYDAIDDVLVGEVEYTASLSYDAIVDGIAEMEVEDESQIFLLINPALKAEVRKDEDYKAAQMGEVVYNGQIGTIAGIPVVVSKAVTEAVLATKDAVTMFLKKDVEVELDRDADTRTNEVYLRGAYVVALTDATSVIKLVKTV